MPPTPRGITKTSHDTDVLFHLATHGKTRGLTDFFRVPNHGNCVRNVNEHGESALIQCVLGTQGIEEERAMQNYVEAIGILVENGVPVNMTDEVRGLSIKGEFS